MDLNDEERWFLLRLGMRPTTGSCWPSLKCSRLGGTTKRAANMKISCLQTMTIASASWIQRAWALDKSVGLKSCQDALSQYPQRSAEEEEILRAENTKILHQLQSLLARVSGLSVSGMKQQVVSPLYQVLISGTVVLPQLRQFWDTLRSELAYWGPYTTNIGAMRMRLPELTCAFLITLVGARVLEKKRTSITNTNPNPNKKKSPTVDLSALWFCPSAKGSDYPQTNASVLEAIAMD